MSAMAPQPPGVSTVCSTVCSGADKRKRESSALLAFVRETSSDQWITLTKRKGFNLMTSSWIDPCGDQINSVQRSKYHGCWFPGSLRRQDTSTHDIDNVE